VRETADPAPNQPPAAESGGALDYASSSTSNTKSALNIVVRDLHQRDQMFWLTILAKFVGGALACLPMPLLAFYVAIANDRNPIEPSWRLFGILFCVATALGFVAAWRWSDNDLLNQVAYLGRTYGPLSPDQPFTQTSWDWEMKGAGAEGLIYLSLLIFGPIWIVSGIQQCRARLKLRPLDYYRAAEAVLTLMQVDHGLSPLQLRRAQEDGRTLAVALAFLHLEDWIDIGAKASACGCAPNRASD
jgi:hypothetical protein